MALHVARSQADGQQRYLCVTIRLPFQELQQDVLDADVPVPESRSGVGAMHGSQGIGVSPGIAFDQGLP